MFDLILAGGAVVDGTGSAAIRADVGIRGERIAAIGDLARADAKRVIDATGLTVAPGFIDTHTHAEGALLVDPQHANGLRQGITTVLLGIDGMSYAPLSRENYLLYRQWLSGLLGDPPEELDMSSVTEFRAHYHRKVAVNTAYLVPHATVRLEVLGFRDLPLVGGPLDKAKRLVREGLEQGAVGFTTGSKYYPGPWADTRELVELCSVVREAGSVYMSEPRATPRAFAGGGPAEAMEIVRRSGVKLHLAHYRTGPDSAGRIEAIMSPIDAARRDDDDVTFDIYPYPSGSSIPVSFLPGEIQEGGPAAILKRLADPTVRGRVGAWLDTHQSVYLGPMTISYAPDAPELEGARLLDLAYGRRRSPGERRCANCCSNSGCASAMSPRPRRARRCTTGSRATAWSFSPGRITWCAATSRRREAAPIRAATGRFPGFLGRYRRGYGTIPLEAMVHRMTDRPARRFGLAGRGRIETGFFADIVVFDAAMVNDTATYARPRAFPVGIPYVIVNGEIAVDQERCTGVYAGQAVP